jgi:hypothetical protein
MAAGTVRHAMLDNGKAVRVLILLNVHVVTPPEKSTDGAKGHCIGSSRFDQNIDRQKNICK